MTVVTTMTRERRRTGQRDNGTDGDARDVAGVGLGRGR